MALRGRSLPARPPVPRCGNRRRHRRRRGQSGRRTDTRSLNQGRCNPPTARRHRNRRKWSSRRTPGGRRGVVRREPVCTSPGGRRDRTPDTVPGKRRRNTPHPRSGRRRILRLPGSGRRAAGGPRTPAGRSTGRRLARSRCRTRTPSGRRFRRRCSGMPRKTWAPGSSRRRRCCKRPPVSMCRWRRSRRGSRRQRRETRTGRTRRCNCPRTVHHRRTHRDCRAAFR